MEKQQNFTDLEYTNRRRTTKREAFLEKMDATLPWEKGIEDAIYDSYAMKTFMGIDFSTGEQVPDATTLCKFRKLLNQHGLQKQFFNQVQELLAKEGKLVSGGTIVDATIVEAPNSTKNREKKRDPEMHSTKKNTKWYFGMRVHIGTDPYYGFVHDIISTSSRTSSAGGSSGAKESTRTIATPICCSPAQIFICLLWGKSAQNRENPRIKHMISSNLLLITPI